jgi:hypothetical protein
MTESKLQGWRERSKGRRKVLCTAAPLWSVTVAAAATRRGVATAAREQPVVEKRFGGGQDAPESPHEGDDTRAVSRIVRFPSCS